MDIGRLVAMANDIAAFFDSEPDKARVMEAIRLIPGLRPVDVGGLDAAATLERMTALAIRINRRYKTKGARFRVIGL